MAGPALVNKLEQAKTDDERPARYALVRTVLDWYRTFIGKPIREQTAVTLTGSRLDEVEQSPTEMDGALKWALEPVIGASPKTSQSLLSKVQGDGLIVHEYVLDADLNDLLIGPPDAVGVRPSTSPLRTMRVVTTSGWRLLFKNNRNGHRPHGDLSPRPATLDAMFNLGAVLHRRDPGTARGWYEKAAAVGRTDAMNNLGGLLEDTDPEVARAGSRRLPRAGWPRPWTTSG